LKNICQFSDQLPKWKDKKSTLLIFDQYLLKIPRIMKWITQFPNRYAVKSGEGLKEIGQLPNHVENLLKYISVTQKVLVMGGGSVGDFGGFVASILKRGIAVEQMPTTWLAALDSSHGGKTAMNVGGYKNQVGTYHFPTKVWIVKSVLQSQPEQRLFEASGEFMKTALIGGEKLLKAMQNWNWQKGQIRWSDLKDFIDVKYQIVKKDPFEKKGIRHQLNLGHTMGHVWEAHCQVPHGLAVFHGLLFDLAWSVQKKMMSAERSVDLMDEMPWSYIWDRQFQNQLDQTLYGLSESKIKSYLLKDKKNKDGMIQFTFVMRPGKVVIREVHIDEILREYRRQQRALQELYETL
jgi:3-dehydroquinate synthase